MGEEGLQKGEPKEVVGNLGQANFGSSNLKKQIYKFIQWHHQRLTGNGFIFYHKQLWNWEKINKATIIW